MVFTCVPDTLDPHITAPSLLERQLIHPPRVEPQHIRLHPRQLDSRVALDAAKTGNLRKEVAQALDWQSGVLVSVLTRVAVVMLGSEGGVGLVVMLRGRGLVLVIVVLRRQLGLVLVLGRDGVLVLVVFMLRRRRSLVVVVLRRRVLVLVVIVLGGRRVLVLVVFVRRGWRSLVFLMLGRNGVLLLVVLVLRGRRGLVLVVLVLRRDGILVLVVLVFGRWRVLVLVVLMLRRRRSLLYLMLRGRRVVVSALVRRWRVRMLDVFVTGFLSRGEGQGSGGEERKNREGLHDCKSKLSREVVVRSSLIVPEDA